jgi:hypothetical protein
MRTRYLAAALMTAVSAFGVRSSAQAPVPSATQEPRLTAEDGAMMMRLMLTRQANRPYGAGSYGTLPDLLPFVQAVHGDATLVDEQTASLRGYTIRLTRSLDRKRFDIAITQDGTCAIGWFSNERNVIYAGKALGCPAQ